MRARDAVAWAAGELGCAGIALARVDAEILVAHVLGTTRSGVYVTDDELDPVPLRALVARRGRHEPLAYVLGEWGFRRLTLRVDARVLVPRPETEVVVERCLALLAGAQAPAVLDVGTGSGAIALAIADEHPGARVTAIDRSPGAVELARENAERCELDVRLVVHDVADGLPSGSWDLVVSNPPYVLAEELQSLEPEVRDWEPRDAVLDRGQTGAVVRAARSALRPGGWLVVETHGHGAHAVACAVTEHGFGAPRITRDLAGWERVVEAEWGG